MPATFARVVAPYLKESTMNKKTALLAQVFMTFLMAASMSGIMGLLMVGPSLEWLAAWPLQFLIAWPIAFALTMVAWPASMGLARKLAQPRRAARADAGAA